MRPEASVKGSPVTLSGHRRTLRHTIKAGFFSNRFILDSNLEGIVCEALVAIAEPVQHHPFPRKERPEKIGVGFNRIQRLVDCGQSSREGAIFIQSL